MNTLIATIIELSPYAAATFIINFLVLLLKQLPKYEAYKRYLAFIVGVIAVVVYFVSSDLGWFAAIATSTLTWEAFSGAYSLIKKA